MIEPKRIKKRKRKIVVDDDDLNENVPLKLKKSYVDLSYIDPFFHKVENESDFDFELSEEFLSAIIKCVEDLSILITNGDPNIERTIDVNQNLNNAVNCYREILDERAESKYQ